MNLAQYLEDTARKHPDRVAVRHEGQAITYQDLNTRCNQLANGLKDSGLTAGDHCMVMMPNSIQVIIIYYALAKLGAVQIPINTRLEHDPLAYVLQQGEPALVIADRSYLQALEETFSINAARIPMLLRGTAASAEEDLRAITASAPSTTTRATRKWRLF